MKRWSEIILRKSVFGRVKSEEFFGGSIFNFVEETLRICVVGVE